MSEIEPKYKIGDLVAIYKKFVDINCGTDKTFGFTGTVVNFYIVDNKVYYEVKFGSKSIARFTEDEITSYEESV